MFRVNLKGFGAMLHRRKVVFCKETGRIAAWEGGFVSRAKQIVAAMQKMQGAWVAQGNLLALFSGTFARDANARPCIFYHHTALQPRLVRWRLHREYRAWGGGG
jgi:hypothetical protein